MSKKPVSDKKTYQALSDFAIRVGSLLDNLRFADQPQVIGSNHAKRPVLLKICRIKRDCSYLLVGTFHRIASKIFSRRVTIYAADRDFEARGGNPGFVWGETSPGPEEVAYS